MILRRPILALPSTISLPTTCICHLQHSIPTRPIPKPIPFIPDHTAFLRAIGRGLSALLPGGEEVPRGTQLQEVEIERLVTGRYQPRRGFAPERLEELASSIREHGVVQPLVVVPRGLGRAAKRAGGGSGSGRSVREISVNERLDVGAVRVTAVPARHGRWPLHRAARPQRSRMRRHGGATARRRHGAYSSRA